MLGHVGSDGEAWPLTGELIERVDAATIWPPTRGRPERAYLFFGRRYWRYDPVRDWIDWIEGGYPKLISEEWPGLWHSGVDAAIAWPRKVEGRQKAYFFRGPEYIRWDIEDDRRDEDYPRSIAKGWPTLPSSWHAGIDTVCLYPDQKLRFFRADEYCVYDPENDKVEGPEKLAKAQEFSQLGGRRVDAAVLWPKVSSNAELHVVYLFSGRRYARVTFKSVFLKGEQPRAEAGRLRLIADNWNRRFQLAVFTTGPDVDSTACHDARLRGEPGGPAFPDGPPYGQGGWDWGIRFENFDDLLAKLGGRPPKHVADGPIQPGQLTRLAICQHGAPGAFFINGYEAYDRYVAYWSNPKATKQPGPHDYGLTIEVFDRRPDILGRIARLKDLCSADATVMLAACNAGQGASGEKFLARLSVLLPGRTVVGFSTIGVVLADKMIRPGARCNEAGMRESRNVSGGDVSTRSWRNKEYEAAWDDLQELPWASPVSRNAVVAKDGQILRKPVYQP